MTKDMTLTAVSTGDKTVDPILVHDGTTLMTVLGKYPGSVSRDVKATLEYDDVALPGAEPMPVEDTAAYAALKGQLRAQIEREEMEKSIREQIKRDMDKEKAELDAGTSQKAVTLSEPGKIPESEKKADQAKTDADKKPSVGPASGPQLTASGSLVK